MLVSIIIASRNGEKYIQNCLQSLLREKSHEYEIIIVDDASIDKTVDIIRPYALRRAVHLIPFKKNKGLSAARNAGVARSTGKYLFFVDQDTETSLGWLRGIVAFFEKNKTAGAGQAKLLILGKKRFDSAGELISAFGFLVERARYAKDRGQFDTEDFIFSSKGAGFIVRRDVFENVGGFDESYKMYLEETDLCWRVWLAGYTVHFIPSVTIHHAFALKPVASYHEHKVYARGSRNTLKTLTTNLGIVRLFYILPIHYLVWTILSVLFLATGNYTKARDILDGIVVSVKTLPKTLEKRQHIQVSRQISDAELFKKVGTSVGFRFYFVKALQYVTNKPTKNV